MRESGQRALAALLALGGTLGAATVPTFLAERGNAGRLSIATPAERPQLSIRIEGDEAHGKARHERDEESGKQDHGGGRKND